MSKPATPIITPLDPWLGCTLALSREQREALHPAERPPRHWSLLLPEQRLLLGGLAHAVLAKHGPLTPARLLFVRARFVEALGATWSHEARGGYLDDLSPFHVLDPAERSKWAALGRVVGAAGQTLQDELLVGLATAGDLAATLRARRDAIDAQLARVSKLTQPAPSPEAA